MQPETTTHPDLPNDHHELWRVANQLFDALAGLSHGHIGGVMCWCERADLDAITVRQWNDPSWKHEPACIAAREAYLAAGGAA